MSRTLLLRRETLAELTPDDLVAVVGAAAPPTVPVAECVAVGDLSRKLGCVGSYECPTYTC